MLLWFYIVLYHRVCIVLYRIVLYYVYCMVWYSTVGCRNVLYYIACVFSNSKIAHNDAVYDGDMSGESFSYGTWFYLKNGGYASITCTEMGEKVRNDFGWTDELSIGISNQEFMDYLRSEAY